MMEQETRFIGPGYFFFQSSSDQFRRFWAHNRRLFLFFCDTKGTLEGLLMLKPILCNVRLFVRWDMLCDAPTLNSAVICRIVALLLLRTMRATRLSPLSFTSFFQPE
ncbi:hypothetical protein AVEN_118089-1 [Araneus ventricosus]|uniref:Uncharacterized protein n=1 Tax=Araneus ventricosus TaxID=182803 RepID=A0A4Y2MY05_ARAVE|nr:hypothetical protein AVEN_118089-1 [Araneus ventricosus]